MRRLPVLPSRAEGTADRGANPQAPPFWSCCLGLIRQKILKDSYNESTASLRRMLGLHGGLFPSVTLRHRHQASCCRGRNQRLLDKQVTAVRHPGPQGDGGKLRPLVMLQSWPEPTHLCSHHPSPTCPVLCTCLGFRAKGQVFPSFKGSSAGISFHSLFWLPSLE